MGNQPSATESHKAISATRAVAETYLSFMQNISQGSFANQVVAVNCNYDPENFGCIDCIQGLKDSYVRDGLKPDLEYISAACKPACECKIENVKLRQDITVDLSADLSAVASSDFTMRAINNIYAQAQQSGTDMFGIASRTSATKTSQESITEIFSKIQQGVFQESIQGLQTLQNVTLSGPGNIATVDMTSAVDYVSNVLMSSEDVASLLTKTQTEMLALTLQVIDAGFAQLILIIVQIVMLSIMFALVMFMFNQGFRFLTLSG